MGLRQLLGTSNLMPVGDMHDMVSIEQIEPESLGLFVFTRALFFIAALAGGAGGRMGPVGSRYEDRAPSPLALYRIDAPFNLGR